MLAYIMRRSVFNLTMVHGECARYTHSVSSVTVASWDIRAYRFSYTEYLQRYVQEGFCTALRLTLTYVGRRTVL